MSDTAYTKDGEAGFGDYIALLKPRVMSLVVFTALVGILVAPGQMHPFVAMTAILFIALGAGASGALNMWWDADIDAVMKRTARRPVPAGRVQPGEALGFGLALSGIAVVMLALATNLLAAGVRAVSQNIVIGGAAGAFPPMIGWAAVTGGVSVESVLMFMVIFMWTPPHFWALALFMNDDYSKAGVPMLTVTHGKKATRNHILVYTIALVPFAVGAAFTSIGGPIYLAVSVLLNAGFLWGAWRIWKRDEVQAVADKYATEKQVFKFSLFYLFLHFGAFLAEAALKPYGLGGW
jgi:protoheme IX farnesyltransferase